MVEKLHETKEWYDEIIAPLVTTEFEKWWLEYYGPVEDFVEGVDTETEATYYIRKTFAWHGWTGRGHQGT